MYVSQVPATVLYTILKTILLILLTQTIYSICAFINRYDLAKIFEQGNITVLIGSLTSDRYKKYHGIFLYLFIAISLEIIIGLLPTIATKYMPFESVIISDNLPKYFKSNLNTPLQYVNIINNSNSMNRFCQNMGLCDTNGEYYNDTLLISPTMKINNVPYDFTTNEFINEFINISVIYNNINSNTINDTNKKLSIKIINSTYSITETMGDITTMQAFSKNNSYYITHYNSLSPMLYSGFIEMISVFHKSYVFSNGKNILLFVTKAVTYNYPFPGIMEGLNKFNNVFNNSKYLYKYTKDNNTNIAYTTYKTDNGYIAIDMLQIINGTKSTVSKCRFLYNLYSISDDNIDYENLNNIYSPITSYNMTHSSVNYGIINSNDSIVDNLNDEPSNDLFTYAMLYTSNKYMYGTNGHREIAANISPVFIGLMVSIIILFLIIILIIRYIRNNLYYSTLLETIGIEELNNIFNNKIYNKENINDEKLLDNN